MELVTEVSKFSNLQAYDLDLNMADQNDCKYYTVNEFQKLNLQKKFNIFHSNVNGLESKFENLHEFLTSASSNMDIVAITETSQKSNENFIKNVTIEAYDIYSTGSHSARGGMAIYVNNNFNSFERNNLKIYNDEFESVWIAINKGNKNIICGCLYRHPRNNSKDFLSYLEKCLLKLSKENKEVYICGDFNFDLLKLENNHICQEF